MDWTVFFSCSQSNKKRNIPFRLEWKRIYKPIASCGSWGFFFFSEKSGISLQNSIKSYQLIYRQHEFQYSPTTWTKPNCVLAVTVLIWHMYLPWSSSLTLFMCKNHVRCLSCLSCVTLIRGFRVMTWLWTVKIALREKCVFIFAFKLCL